MVYRQEVQGQPAEATRRVVPCGELGTRREVSEKHPPSLGGVASGRKGALELSPAKAFAFQLREDESKSWSV